MKRPGLRSSTAWLIWLLLAAGPVFAQTVPTFTAEERRWIKAHPVVDYAADMQLPPIEYVENGQYKGLASEYLRAVSRKSGLRFKLVPTKHWQDAQRAFLDGRADLLPNVFPRRVSNEVGKQLLFSDPYFAAPSIIVTRADAPVILNIKDLNGKVVAIRGGGSYANVFASHYPEVKTLFFDDPDAGLDAVTKGEAYAAIGTDMAFLPLMRRKYAGRLSISGTAGDLLYTPMQMGVRKDLPLLHAIVAKSLGSLSAQETDRMNEKWLEQTDFGEPSLLSIIRYRAPQLLLLCIGIALLGWFAYRARVAQRAAQKSEREKSRFLAIMSHEIRTPMNAVLASIEMLQRSSMDDRQKRLASTASTAAESLLGLLDDVLDLSKLDAKRLELELIPTDIGLLAHKAADVARANAKNKALPVNVSVDNPSGCDVLIDPTRFRQVLMNLLGNSVKFTERGRIDLDVRIAAPAEPGNPGSVSVTVTDTGVGIPREQQAGIFEAYSQAESSTTRRYGGTGLGLTICKELVELMGGQIALQSEPGAGTRIAFTVPARLVARTEAIDNAIDQTAIGSGQARFGGTVLVVEDHPGNQFIIAEQLKELGVSAKIVSDGHAALAAIQQQPFALVLMDCHMPEMSGYETTRHIREREADESHIPVIAISAATDSAHLSKCMDSGMDGVLKKPLRLDELRGMLQLWLGETSASMSGNRHKAASLPVDLHALYKASMKEDMVALQAAVADGDHRLATHLAHRIKGAALMADADAMASCAEKLEAILESGAQDRETAARALDDLDTEVTCWLSQSLQLLKN